MKKLFICILIIIVILISGSSLIISEPVEKIVAKINDEIITLSDFEKYIKGYLDDDDFNNSIIERKARLEELIYFELIEQLGEKYSIVVLDLEIDETISNIMKSYNFKSKEEFEQYLNETNQATSLYVYKKKYKAAMIQNQLAYKLLEMNDTDIDIRKPTSEEIRVEYEKNIEEYITEGKRKIRHIVITGISGENAGEKYSQADEKIELMKEKLENGEATFTELAEKYSHDENTKYDGGLLGEFEKSQLQMLYPYYTETVFSGEVKEGDNKVIWTNDSVAIVNIMEIEEGRTKSFSEVYNQIRSQLFIERFSEEFPKYIGRFQENSKIEIFLQN